MSLPYSHVVNTKCLGVISLIINEETEAEGGVNNRSIGIKGKTNKQALA